LSYYPCFLSLIYSSSSSSRGKCPPLRTGWLPWLGCAVEFGKEPLNFINRTKDDTIHQLRQENDDLKNELAIKRKEIDSLNEQLYKDRNERRVLLYTIMRCILCTPSCIKSCFLPTIFDPGFKQVGPSINFC